MSKFKKKRGANAPKISTASLPDIIFMLLFFFMMVTVLRDAELMLQVNTPSATELTKLEKKSLVHHMYVGKPIRKYQDIYGTSPRMQLGDKFSDLNDIPLFIEKHRLKVPENQRGAIMTSLKIDGKVTMGIVGDIKNELRRSGQFKVNYSAKAREEIY